MKQSAKIDLSSYIKGEEKPQPKSLTPTQKKRQAGIFLGVVTMGNLMIDYIDEMDSMNSVLGMKQTEELTKGYKALTEFVESFTDIFSGIVDVTTHTMFTDLQNRLNYTIMKEIKEVPKHLKK